jgi:molecular chaperone HtpG
VPRLELPGYLDEKLSWTSALGRDVSALVDAVSAIATHNKTPFFPAYTDHGIDHLAAVLRWCVELTPPEAVADLGEEDAAVIVGAALLHDIGMHLSEEGFAELVGGGWHDPLPWFDESHEGRPADRPWPDLWDDFRREARHFDRTEMVRLLGSNDEGVPKVVVEDELVLASLDRWDKLYVGEFLRRHHARLAHEVAVFGFPGLGDTFPRAPQSPKGVADVRRLMGLVARSHNEPLRMIIDHLDDHEGGDLTPAGVHLTFVAGLLRIADYAQLGDDRAPSILLRMTAPQSPLSIQAWKDHDAVTMVRPQDAKDPGALRFRVSPEI